MYQRNKEHHFLLSDPQHCCLNLGPHYLSFSNLEYPLNNIILTGFADITITTATTSPTTA